MTFPGGLLKLTILGKDRECSLWSAFPLTGQYRRTSPCLCITYRLFLQTFVCFSIALCARDCTSTVRVSISKSQHGKDTDSGLKCEEMLHGRVSKQSSLKGTWVKYKSVYPATETSVSSVQWTTIVNVIQKQTAKSRNLVQSKQKQSLLLAAKHQCPHGCAGQVVL